MCPLAVATEDPTVIEETEISSFNPAMSTRGPAMTSPAKDNGRTEVLQRLDTLWHMVTWLLCLFVSGLIIMLSVLCPSIYNWWKVPYRPGGSKMQGTTQPGESHPAANQSKEDTTAPKMVSHAENDVRRTYSPRFR